MANRLNWSLGHEGKGNVYPNGDISTWNINEYEEPHHDQQSALEKREVDPAFRFYISPEGGLNDGGLGFTNHTYSPDDQIIKEIVEQHPAVWDGRDQIDDFASSPRYETADGGYGHAQSLLAKFANVTGLWEKIAADAHDHPNVSRWQVNIGNADAAHLQDWMNHRFPRQPYQALGGEGGWEGAPESSAALHLYETSPDRLEEILDQYGHDHPGEEAFGVIPQGRGSYLHWNQHHPENYGQLPLLKKYPGGQEIPAYQQQQFFARLAALADRVLSQRDSVAIREGIGVPPSSWQESKRPFGEFSIEAGSAFFSEPHEDLDPTFWEDGKLKPDFAEKIRNDFDRVFDEFNDVDNWSSLWIAGSVTGYQYIKDDSDPDLDVQVVIDYSAFKDANSDYEDMDWTDARAELHAVISKIDGEPLTGDIELNYFIRPESDVETWKKDAEDLGQGVYSIDEDRWEVEPPENPKQTHIFEEDLPWIPEAERLVDKAQDLIKQYEGDPSDKHLEALKRLYKKLWKGRKDSFSGEGGQRGKGNFIWQWMEEWGPLIQLKEIVGGHLPKIAKEEGWADFHTELKLPRATRKKIRRWVDRLKWPEGSEKEDARRYHITILSMDEYDEDFAKWARQQMQGRTFNFKSTRMDIFGDEHVVLRLECPEWTEVVEHWQDVAKEQGLEPRVFNPPKAHVTIGKTPSGKWPQGVPDPHVKFDTRMFNINKNSATENEPDLSQVTDPLLRSVIEGNRYDLHPLHTKQEQFARTPRFTFAINPRITGPQIQVGTDHRGKPIFYDSNLAIPSESGPRLQHPDYQDQIPFEKDPNYLYRGISKEEMDAIRNQGYIQSHGQWNIADSQKDTTSFTSDPRMALSYASNYAPWHLHPTFDHPGYVLKVDQSAVPKADITLPENEYSAKGQIPLSAIHQVAEVRPYAISPGEVDLADSSLWEGGIPRGNLVSGSRRGTVENNGYRILSPQDALQKNSSERWQEAWDEYLDRPTEAEMVPTEAMSPYREYDRDIDAEKYTQDLRDHIAQHGMTEAIKLEYNPDTGIAHIGEGNHRLKIAEELGLSHVPVEVLRTSRNPSSVGLSGAPLPNPPQPDQYGYVPGLMRPSEVGLPTKTSSWSEPVAPFSFEAAETTPADELLAWTQGLSGKTTQQPPSLHHADPSQMQPQQREPVVQTPHVDPPSKPYKPYNWAEDGWEENPLDRTSAADPEWLQRWIEINGPYLYHYTHPHLLGTIKNRGIIPWNAPIAEPPGSEWEGQALQPRPGHVYLTSNPEVKMDAEEGRQGQVAVDIRNLDPSRFMPDEDAAVTRFPKWKEIPGYEDLSDPEAIETYKYPRGQWAEDRNLTHPAMVEDSLHHGTVAYRGSIPPEAIADVRSPLEEPNAPYMHPFARGNLSQLVASQEVDTHLCPRCGEDIEGQICNICGYNPQDADDFKQAERDWYDRAWSEPGNQPRPVPNQPMHWGPKDHATDVKYAKGALDSTVLPQPSPDQRHNARIADSENLPLLMDHPRDRDPYLATHEDRSSISNDESPKEDSRHEVDHFAGRNFGAASKWDFAQPQNDLHPLWATKRSSSRNGDQRAGRPMPPMWPLVRDSAPLGKGWREI